MLSKSQRQQFDDIHLLNESVMDFTGFRIKNVNINN